MDFKSFIEANPELNELSYEEQLDRYDLYLAGLAESMDDWVLS